MLMRPHVVRFSVPVLLGTAHQCPSDFARYSLMVPYDPYVADNSLTTSSAGSSLAAKLPTSQLYICMKSCPLAACASAAAVIRILFPLDVMKSTVTSTLFLLAQLSTCFCIT